MTNDKNLETVVTEEQVANAETTEVVAGGGFFDLLDAPEEGAERDREDIIKAVVASGKGRVLKGLNVRNVVTNRSKGHAFLTFVVKEFVMGDTRSTEVDAFGEPIVVLGKTHNVVTGAYAVASVMKDTPKARVFANKFVREMEEFAVDGVATELPEELFAGGKIDVLMEYVVAGEEYINPFATNPEPVIFERDKVICHVIALTLGEAGLDKYSVRLAR